MTILRALKKIIERHGEETFAEVYWLNSNGWSLPRRLDLEYAICLRDQYEHDNIHHSSRPFPNRYRLSVADAYLENVTAYRIFSVDEKTGEMKIDAEIIVYKGLEYQEYDWHETFSESKYSFRAIPWWLRT